MNTNKHGLKRTTRRPASAIGSAVLPEPKLPKAEKLEVERAWKIEIRRRRADFRAGKAKCVPAEQALRNAYRAVNRVAQNRRQTKPLLINTGLQPGVSGRRMSLAVSTASRSRGKAVKTAGTARVRQTTGLKSGVNENAIKSNCFILFAANYSSARNSVSIRETSSCAKLSSSTVNARKLWTSQL